jgi:hypothetical protein
VTSGSGAAGGSVAPAGSGALRRGSQHPHARRRSPGEGGACSYKTKASERWYWKAVVRGPDGIERVKVKRGFLTKTTSKDDGPAGALVDMREALSAVGKGEYIEPSKRTAGSWLDEWLGTLRLSPSTVASYRKNIRLHVSPTSGMCRWRP